MSSGRLINMCSKTVLFFYSWKKHGRESCRSILVLKGGAVAHKGKIDGVKRKSRVSLAAPVYDKLSSIALLTCYLLGDNRSRIRIGTR